MTKTLYSGTEVRGTRYYHCMGNRRRDIGYERFSFGRYILSKQADSFRYSLVSFSQDETNMLRRSGLVQYCGRQKPELD